MSQNLPFKEGEIAKIPGYYSALSFIRDECDGIPHACGHFKISILGGAEYKIVLTS